MKLIIAIVQDDDASRLVSTMTEHGFRVTKLATTGGFLRSGNTTLLVGVEDAELPKAMNLIEKTCKSRRTVTTAPAPVGGINTTYAPYPLEVTVGGATVFVLTVDSFVKL